ncbi:MAG: VanZ family protein [Gemmatimonadota bacterium]|nr:VanZ family protein [Gemmatimonadota bacterium]
MPVLTQSGRSRSRAVGVVLVALVLGAISLATLGSRPGEPPEPDPWCFVCGALNGIDFILNIALFIPLGIALRVAGATRRRSLLVIVGTTLAIEVLQLGIPGRVTSSGDLAANSLGGAIGVALGEWWRTVLIPAGPLARRMTLVAAAGWLSALGLTLWLFEPAFPDARYWGQIAPELGQFDHFRGRVLGAYVGDIPIPSHEMPDSRAVRDLLSREGTVVQASIISERLTIRVAPIVSMFDGRQREIFVLGQEGANLMFRIRRRAVALGLNPPSISMWGVLHPRPEGRAPGDTLVVSAWHEGYRMHLAADLPDRRIERTLLLRPTWGWALIFPFERTSVPSGRVFTMVWVAFLVFPLGYYAALAMQPAERRTPRGRASRWWPLAAVPIVVAAALAVGLEAIPRAVGAGPAQPGEWQGVAMGIAAGLAVSSLALVITRAHSRIARAST